MKTQFINSGEQTGNTDSMQKESMAKSVNGKIFSAADLWNIQKQHRSINQRRRSL